MTSRLASAFAALLATLTVSPNAIGQSHPLEGQWQWTRQATNCTETYDYRSDGTYHVISGEEITEGTYQISATPGQNGFYTLTATQRKTNGKKDCSDAPATSELAPPYTVYIAFHRSEPMYIACEEPKIDRCFGPLRRTGK